jgi:hypothetical protein
MRILNIVMTGALLAAIVPAQDSTNNSAPPSMEILNKSWHREVINTKLNSDPFRVNDQTRDMQISQKQPSDYNPKRPDAQRAVQPKTPSSKGPSSGSGRRIEAYFYRTKVKNNSDKTIRAIAWEYVFITPDTKTEISRFQCSSKIKINPGKSSDLIMRASVPPSNVLDVTKLDKGAEQFIERIIISRIEYDDGSVWQRP